LLVGWVSWESRPALLGDVPWIGGMSVDGVQFSLARELFDCTKRFGAPNLFARKNLGDLARRIFSKLAGRGPMLHTAETSPQFWLYACLHKTQKIKLCHL